MKEHLLSDAYTPGTVALGFKVSRDYPHCIKKETDSGKLHDLNSTAQNQYVTKLGQILNPSFFTPHYTFSFKSIVIPQIRTAAPRFPTINLNVLSLLK